MTAPATCPPIGICVPVRLVRVVDGDTLLVRLRHGATEWKVRLRDCWCPELRRGDEASKDKGRKAKEFVEQVLAGPLAGDLRCFVPLPLAPDDQPLRLLEAIGTMGRVLGYVFLGESENLSRMLVAARLASTTKDGELGK